MKNTTFLFLFFCISFQSFSQAVETKIYSSKKIIWDEEEGQYYRAPEDSLSQSVAQIIMLNYDVINVLSTDTTNLFLNESPIEREDNTAIIRTWFKAVNDLSKNMFVQLFYFKNSDSYMLRTIDLKTNKGFEYYSEPINKQQSVPNKKKR